MLFHCLLDGCGNVFFNRAVELGKDVIHSSTSYHSDGSNWHGRASSIAAILMTVKRSCREAKGTKYSHKFRHRYSRHWPFIGWSVVVPVSVNKAAEVALWYQADIP